MGSEQEKGTTKPPRLTVRVLGAPTTLKLEAIAKLVLLEGTEKKWGSGYRYRLDRRPENHGGDQIHIFGPHGDSWAYRHTGDRSEPGKYTLRANDVVSDIVRDVFSLGKDTVIETVVVSMTPEEVVAEATVA